MEVIISIFSVLKCVAQELTLHAKAEKPFLHTPTFTKIKASSRERLEQLAEVRICRLFYIK